MSDDNTLWSFCDQRQWEISQLALVEYHALLLTLDHMQTSPSVSCNNDILLMLVI